MLELKILLENMRKVMFNSVGTSIIAISIATIVVCFIFVLSLGIDFDRRTKEKNKK